MPKKMKGVTIVFRHIPFLFLWYLTSAVAEEGTRIVGGFDAGDGQFPYQISMRYNGRHICGGSIISPKYILTASHCIDGQKPDNFTVVTGSNLLDNGGNTYKVKKLIQHEGYNSQSVKNDIALLQLTDDIQYGDKVQPIKLPNQNIGDNENVVLSGWGTTSYPGKTPNKLQAIELATISNLRCMISHPILGFIMGGVSSTNVCTLTKAGEGACHGDSGGPLVDGDQQVGVVSWGIPCARGKPDVFTRVYSYLDWLGDKMKDDNGVTK